MRFGSRGLVSIFVCALLGSACNDNAPPTAYSLTFSTPEDTPLTGKLFAADADGSISYHVGVTRHGRVISLNQDGTFVFEPDLNFSGDAGFSYYVLDDDAFAAHASVSITVRPVNDPPQIAPVPDLENSPESEFVEFDVSAVDPDSEHLAFSALVADPTITQVSIEPESGLLRLKASRIGVTQVDVFVSDGEHVDSTSFAFTVGEVAKHRLLRVAERGEAIAVVNRSGEPVEFALEHNGYPVFTAIEEIVDHVHAWPEAFPNEPFARKLWRFLRDATYHYHPLMPLQFAEAPWATLNSLGFGFCGDIATSYVAIARAAGYEARVWSIGGHIVPEIYSEGAWRLYDPDLAVYYLNSKLEVAGVEELTADPNLIREPIAPILPTDGWAYSELVADLYATPRNNKVDERGLLLPYTKDVLGKFHLPPGAALIYPGRWTEPPIAYDVFATVILEESLLSDWSVLADQHDGKNPYPVPFHKQAQIALPEGWTGEVSIPLWLWDIQGSGSVAIDEITYAIGSEALVERLRYRVPARSVRILSGSEIKLIMQLNFKQFYLEAENQVRLRGVNVWALDVAAVNIGTSDAGENPRAYRPGSPRP